MLQPDFMDLGEIEFGIEKEVEVTINNFEEDIIEGKLTVISRWIKLASEENISLVPGGQLDIKVIINTKKTSPGKYWGDILLFNSEKKQFIYKKILVADIVVPDTKPEIEIVGNTEIFFKKEVPIKIINNKIDFNCKYQKHFITIKNKSQEKYFQGYISIDKDVFWLNYDIGNKRQVIIAPGQKRDVAIIADMEKLWEKRLEYAEGKLTITNNSENLPEIICSVKLETSFECPPYPAISLNNLECSFLKPGNHIKEFTITNTGGEILKGHITTVDSNWLEIEPVKFEIKPEESKNIKVTVKISPDLSNEELLKGKINIEFNNPSKISREVIDISAKVDKRTIMVEVFPDYIDFGNIIKGGAINKSFKIRHNDVSPINFSISTLRGNWLELVNVCNNGKEKKKIVSGKNKFELNILPEETWEVYFKIDTELCKSGTNLKEEIKIEAVKRDLPNKFVNINLSSMDPKDLLVDFEERPINLGDIKPGENLSKILNINHLGSRYDIKLAGNVRSLTDWLKVEKGTFELNNGTKDNIKISTLFTASNETGRKEGTLLINYIPEKCSPSFETIPQQVETVIVNIKEKKQKQLSVLEVIEPPVVKKSLRDKIVGIPGAIINYFRK